MKWLKTKNLPYNFHKSERDRQTTERGDKGWEGRSRIEEVSEVGRERGGGVG